MADMAGELRVQENLVQTQGSNRQEPQHHDRPCDPTDDAAAHALQAKHSWRCIVKLLDTCVVEFQLFCCPKLGYPQSTLVWKTRFLCLNGYTLRANPPFLAKPIYNWHFHEQMIY